MGLKDDLKNDGNAQAYTLNKEEVQFLAHINAYLQAELDAIQQHFAAAYLNRVAVDRLGFEAGKDLRFNFDPSKETNNLTITEISEK